MDDFLHNLRTNNPKAFDRNNRRNFDGNRFKPTDRPNQKDKRKVPPQRPFPQGDQMLVLKKAADMMADAATRHAAALERIVEAEERKAAALESLIASLEKRFESQEGKLSIAQNELAPQLNSASDDAGDPLTETVPREDREAIDRPALIARINELRNNGTSYERIAQIFEEENVQTLSGRGKWRGQTIFRLSKEDGE